MSENPGAAEAQAATDAQPAQAATTAASQADASTQSTESLPEWARKELAELRKAEARRRVADKQRTDAELTDAQRFKAQADDLATTNATLSRELRTLKAQAFARDAGAIYPDLVADKLSDEALSGDKQTRDREIDRLRKAYPSLFRVGTADGAVGREGPAAAGDMNAAIRRAAGRGS